MAPLYCDAAEARNAWTGGEQIVERLMAKALSEAGEATRALARDLFTATLSDVGKRFSGTPWSADEIATCADPMVDMFCAYLETSRK